MHYQTGVVHQTSVTDYQMYGVLSIFLKTSFTEFIFRKRIISRQEVISDSEINVLHLVPVVLGPSPKS